MEDIKRFMDDLGFGAQMEISNFINSIDDKFGEGSAHRHKSGKSWGDVTEDNWEDDPTMSCVCKGNAEEILSAYADLRRNGARGWIGIATDDWQSFSMWQPNK